MEITHVYRPGMFFDHPAEMEGENAGLFFEVDAAFSDKVFNYSFGRVYQLKKNGVKKILFFHGFVTIPLSRTFVKQNTGPPGLWRVGIDGRLHAC